MTDREMLELAAKAAGIPIDRSDTNGGGVGNDGFGLTGDLMLDWHNDIRWNPLRDDGDALRLAVKLRMDVEPWVHGDSACARVGCGEILVDEPHYGDDPERATRRAIVRAAAEIGKAMP